MRDVVFVAGTRGQMRTRGARTSIAVIRTQDTALTGVVGTLVFSDDTADAGSVVAVSATCYDRAGVPVLDVTPTVR